MKQNQFSRFKKLCLLSFIATISSTIFPQKLKATENYDGSFRVLTYNIAALPWPAYLSNPAGNPANRVPYIGQRIYPFDIVGVQEQLAWIDTFRNPTHHPHYSINKKLYSGGNGIDILSKFPMTKTIRVTYTNHPAYIAKGFTKNTLTIYPGVYLDVYNTHTGDAKDGANPSIIYHQLSQLGEYIKAHTPTNRAVIVTGDLNCHPNQTHHGLVAKLMTPCNLLDARSEAFNEHNSWKGSVDHILYRSGSDLILTLEHYEDINSECAPGTARFTNHFHKDGKKLSDHNPAYANFKYKIPANYKKQSGAKIWLSELTLNYNNSTWYCNGPVGLDQAIGERAEADGAKQHMNGVIYDRGLGVHANNHITLMANKKYSIFHAEVGIDEEVGAHGKVRFQVFTDGTKVFDSGAMTPYSATQQVNIDMNNVTKLQLNVLSEGDANYDHADWANSYFIVK